MNIDVLNLEWMSYSARDRNMSSLICNYLRYQGLSVIEESVFRGFKMIDRYHPKLMFIANGVGALINFNLVKYASLKGIKVVTLISEGNFKDDFNEIPQFFWGWNKDHRMYEDSHMQWSERTRNMSLIEYPGCKGKIKVSGGCGFDIYKIKPPVSKKQYLEMYGKGQYSRVIGVGCWDFGHCYTDNIYSESSLSIKEKERFRTDRDLFNEILINIISANPSILFILKEHPGNIGGHFMSGIEGSENFDNVIILKKEPIFDIIAISDFWLTYESTTVFEAWLLGKQTCLLNPTGVNFPRANVYLGSPNYPDEETMQKAIDAFYETGQLPLFYDEKMAVQRKNTIIDTIQWDDGLCHVRAGNEIIRVFEDSTNKKKCFIPFDIRFYKAKQNLINTLKIKKSSIYEHSSSFSRKEVQDFSSSLFDDQITFYNSLGLSKEDLRKLLPI